MLTPEGVRHEFNSTEIVTVRLSGNALLIEGRHTAKDDPARVVHDAITMLAWDESRKEFRFRTALANGRGGDFTATVQENGLTWNIPSDSGRIEYVIEHRDGFWVERGRLVQANGTTRNFFEMNLTKR